MEDYEATDEEVLACAHEMKVEITNDIVLGIVPVTVRDFSELHDYVDPNTYAGLCERDDRAHWSTDSLVRVQDIVHAWLAAGHQW